MSFLKVYLGTNTFFFYKFNHMDNDLTFLKHSWFNSAKRDYANEAGVESYSCMIVSCNNVLDNVKYT